MVMKSDQASLSNIVNIFITKILLEIIRKPVFHQSMKQLLQYLDHGIEIASLF
jgi:hypothetical protein